jgi:plastocyanin
MLIGIAGIGALAPTVVGIGAALAHDDHDDDDEKDDDHSGDDDDHGDHDDSGHDDDDSGAKPAVLADGSFEVRITDDDEDAFVPRLVSIEPGQTISFVNNDDKDHTATGGGWDTGVLAPGATGTVTFDEPGEFAYTCQFHPQMTGTIMVGGAEASPMASPEATPASAGDAVRIFNLLYDPAELSVSAGTTVTWTNDDTVSHTVTSADGEFDTGQIEAGATATLTFDTAGTFEYVCAYHAGMRATVVVS